MLSEKKKIVWITCSILLLAGCGSSSKKSEGQGVNSPPASTVTTSAGIVKERENPAYTPSSEMKTGNENNKTNESGDGSTILASNAFIPEKVKIGDRVGAFSVSDIKRDSSYISVRFKGKVTIKGNYNSDKSLMYGKYISLNPDASSKVKIPNVTGSDTHEFVLDPQYQKDVDLIKLFGDTGKVGKFEIELEEFLVTDWVESFKRIGKLSKVITIGDNNKK